MSFQLKLLKALGGIALLFTASVAIAGTGEKPEVGEKVDIAQFAQPLAGDNYIGVQWDNPRNVYEVRVRGLSKKAAKELTLEWWGSTWPLIGTSGWKRLDDPFNVKWVKVDTEPEVIDGVAVFHFPHFTKEEFDREPSPPLPEPIDYRRTLKVRVLSEQSMPKNAQLSAYNKSKWEQQKFNIETRVPQDGQLNARVELTNGVLADIKSLPAPRSVSIKGMRYESPERAAGSAGVQLDLFYVANDAWDSNDLTRVTVRLGKSRRATGFSFVPQDVLKDDVMRLPSFNTLVSLPKTNMTLNNDPGPGEEYWDNPVRLRLTEKPEMTRSMAMEGMPRLKPDRQAPIGVPSARQEFFIDPWGNWAMWGLSIGNRRESVYKSGRDSQRIPFRYSPDDHHLAQQFYALLDTSHREQPAFDGEDREDVIRYLHDGFLPLVHVEWHTGPISYKHNLTSTILFGDYGDDVSRRGDETVVILTRLDVTNEGDSPKKAVVNLCWTHEEPISLKDNGVVAINPRDESEVPEDLTAIRGVISNGKPANGGVEGWKKVTNESEGKSDILRWTAELKPGESRTIYFKEAFVDLLEEKEIDRIKKISYETETPKVLNYWRDRLARGMIIETPDEALNNFYKANLWHIVITTDRDPQTGLYNQGVGTVRYLVFPNETVMIARSMDMRGEHEEARRFLEPMLAHQGEEELKGRFSTKEGAFHSAGEYTHGEYAMNHGFVLWGVADHYMMTHDDEYMKRVAPQLVKGCDFLIDERQSTMTKSGEPRSRIHGLSPASSLEDVVEYKYWFSTNAYYYLGMKRVAEALRMYGHPEAQRITKEAEKYRQDIEIAMRESTTRSAAAQLRDGTWIPYLPSRVYQWRHLTEGWIREALYPALHLATGEVVEEDDQLITWMLDDLEDRIYFSWQSGFNVQNFEEKWFELGAVTKQPCLVELPIIYMARNEIKAALRSFWNTYALSIYPDMACFAEWARNIGEGGGPLYKTSDEARFVMWLRELLIWENGRDLWFGRGMPREWLQNGKTTRIANTFTKFGEAGMTICSHADDGYFVATLDIPTKITPDNVYLRVRDPQNRLPVSVVVNDLKLDDECIAGEDIRLDPEKLDLSKPVKIRVIFTHTQRSSYDQW